MKLIVTEKPSVAIDISKVLGVNNRKDGYIEGKGYIITWCIGHLIQLANPEEYDVKYKKWSFETLPILPEKFIKEVNKQTSKQYNVVKKLMKDKDLKEIICATDAGREGQLIFEYVYQMSGSNKPVKRLWISSMTDEAIKEGFAKLKDNQEYNTLYESARCRAEADWLVGINFTRLFTVKYSTKLTVGRVQTPTLALIVDRYNEILNFIPQPYYQVEGSFDNIKTLWKDNDGNKISDREKALAIQEKVQGKTGIIQKLESKEKTEERPLLFDLTELQREGNRRYGYTAQETLTIAQSLYEKHKLITYPRTDSRYLTEDMKDGLLGLMEKLKKSYEKGKVFIEEILNKGLNYDKRVINNKRVSDHHAIIVTENIDNYDVTRLTIKEKNILELIIVRFIVSLSEKKVFEETELEINIENEVFGATGRKTINEGFERIEKSLLGKSNNEEKEAIQIFDNLSLNQEIVFEKVDVLEKKTTPKKPYTEATILTAMEKISREIEDEELKEVIRDKGLGTPATRAGIIEKLISVGYIERKKKNLHPTEQGIKFIEVIPEELKTAELTAEWEQRLENISRGEESPEELMEDIKSFIKTLTSENLGSVDNQIFRNQESQKEVIGNCPRCGKNIYENKKSFYCEGYKDNPKCNFSLWKEDKFFAARGKKITKTIAKKLLKDGKVEMKKLKSKAGKEYNAVFIMGDTGKYINFKMEFL